ncbi:MAG: alkaline phosphatase, partial [Flavobacteriaceae bacterium]
MKNLFLIFIFFAQLLFSQEWQEFRIHSHNDYKQNTPFWKAFSAGASSIEADVLLISDTLYVAHGANEIDSVHTFERLYLEPLQQVLELGLEKPKNLQLLIDIKSEPYATLDAIIKSLEKYPEVINDSSFSFVISGNRPKPSEYVNYPDYVLFDYQSLDAVTNPSVRNKIALVSLNFTHFSKWNGKGRLTSEDSTTVTATIKKAKSTGKPFRFWATPDSKTAWKALVHLGIDFINTDRPFECAHYLNSLASREYRNSVFSEVYRPSFASDGKKKAPKNIILMIGDGNGLTQISA